MMTTLFACVHNAAATAGPRSLLPRLCPQRLPWKHDNWILNRDELS